VVKFVLKMYEPVHEPGHHWRGWTSWQRIFQRFVTSELYYCSHKPDDETAYAEIPEKEKIR